MSTNTELIAWARDFAGRGSRGVNELADALEAAEAELTRRDTVIAEVRAWFEEHDFDLHDYDIEDRNVRFKLETFLDAAPAVLSTAAEAELTRLREIVLSGTTPGDTGTIYLDPEKTLDQVWDALNGVPAAAPVSLEAAKAETNIDEKWLPVEVTEWRPVETEGDANAPA